MAEKSNIEWTDSTFNPWEGCQKVGPGCDNCYAENRNARFAGGTAVNWGPGAPRRRTSASNWQKPLTWNAQHEAFFSEHGRRRRVFCASLADVFDNEAPGSWRIDLLDLIHRTPHLDWLLLTKRIGNAHHMLNTAASNLTGGAPTWWNAEAWPNVWIGATITSQAEADRDIPKLLAVPAAKRFLSMEPLLGPVDLERPRPGPDLDQGGGRMICQPWLIQSGIDWVIVGGESGPNARPMHPDWARSLRDQCQAAGVPFLFKQHGEWKPINQMEEAEHNQLYVPNVKAKPHEDQGNLNDIHGRRCTVDTTVVHIDGTTHSITEPMAFLQGTEAMMAFKVGKKAAGRLLDGRTWDGVPE